MSDGFEKKYEQPVPQPMPLNAAQIQRVQAELKKNINDQALRKWCIEIAVQVTGIIGMSEAKTLIELAEQIYAFLNPKHEELQ